MSMGTISDLIGLVLVAGAFWAVYKVLCSAKRRNRNKIDGSMYDDVE